MANMEARAQYDDNKSWFYKRIARVTDVYEDRKGYTVLMGFDKEDGDLWEFGEKREGNMVRWWLDLSKEFNGVYHLLSSERGNYVAI